MLLLLCFINTVCFSRQTGSSPLHVSIAIDTVYAYPYKGLWFQNPIRLEDLFSNEKAYKIKVTLQNSGERNIYLHMMTCSKIDQLRIDNELIEFLFWGCDGNYLSYHSLKQGETYTFDIELIRHSDYYTNTGLTFKPFHCRTRIGLKLLTDIYDAEFIGTTFSVRENKNKPMEIIWSNTLNLSLR